VTNDENNKFFNLSHQVIIFCSNENFQYFFEKNLGYPDLEASNDIYIGEQIFINYGCRTDDFLLQSYGFCLPPGHNALTNVRISLIEFSTALLDTMQLSVKEYFEKIVKVL
jgi:hypothetical protein